MPYTPTTPESKDVPGPIVAKDLTTFHLTQLVIEVDPNTDNVTLNVRFEKGYMDGSTFVPVERAFETLAGADVIAAMNSVPSGKSVYDAVKEATWGLLQSRNIIPAGTIS